VKWYNSVKIKLLGFFLVVAIFFLASIVIIFDMIREESLMKSAPIVSSAMTSEILRDTTNTRNKMEELVLTLASVAKEDIKNINVISSIFSAQEDSMIVSGGIWLEPYAKGIDEENHLHFFTKNKQNTFIQTQGYLKEHPSKYREMEFYVTAKYIPKGKTFWTKVYTDPKTNIPMVTVVSPIYDKEKFIGVASVDIMIKSDKNQLFKHIMEFKNEYVMIIGRTGEIIARSDILDKEFKNKNNIYDVISVKFATLFSHIHPELEKEILSDTFDPKLAQKLTKESDGIDASDGKRITSLIQLRKENSERTLVNKVYFIENDLLLGEKSIVSTYHFPFTYWKLVIGIPANKVLAQSNETYKDIMIVTIILTILTTLFGFLLLRNIFIKPIESINIQLKNNLQDPKNKYKFLYSTDKGEIGTLVENLNTRTFALSSSLEREKIEIKKRLENEKLLIQQSKMAAMGEMMDAVAHQWKQPLNALSLYSELIKSDFDAGEVDKNYITEFSKDTQLQIEHMVSTLDEFRRFFRPNEKTQDFDLLEVLDSVLFLTKDEFMKHRITVNIEQKDKIALHGSPNEFKHLILNLISNAKDAFIDNKIEKRVIRISLIEEDDKARLEIKDNAGGIPNDVIDNIFKANVTTKEATNGTGIGLYMSTQIAQKHGATLEALNHNDGACFIVKFGVL